MAMILNQLQRTSEKEEPFQHPPSRTSDRQTCDDQAGVRKRKRSTGDRLALWGCNLPWHTGP